MLTLHSKIRDVHRLAADVDYFLRARMLRTLHPEIKKINMKPTDHNTIIHREARRYTEEQMRILLCMRDMVKEEVKKEVARQIKMINKQ